MLTIKSLAYIFPARIRSIVAVFATISPVFKDENSPFKLLTEFDIIKELTRNVLAII